MVRETGAGKYELIAGERRWRAAKMAGLATVPVVVRETSDQSSVEEALVENLHRKDLTPLEEAGAERVRGFLAGLDRFAGPLAAVAGRMDGTSDVLRVVEHRLAGAAVPAG